MGEIFFPSRAYCAHPAGPIVCHVCLSVYLFVRLSQPIAPHAQLHHYHGHRNVGGVAMATS